MKTIGLVTTYHGTEYRHLRGQKVRIIAVFKNATRPDYDPDSYDNYLLDDADIAYQGGVTADDRVEVQPWIQRERRFSFVTSDPKATDLAAFAHLAR